MALIDVRISIYLCWFPRNTLDLDVSIDELTLYVIYDVSDMLVLIIWRLGYAAFPGESPGPQCTYVNTDGIHVVRYIVSL